MEITGKIIAVLPEQGGTSKSGNEWKKQEYVLEMNDQSQYPKKVCFDGRRTGICTGSHDSG